MIIVVQAESDNPIAYTIDKLSMPIDPLHVTSLIKLITAAAILEDQTTLKCLPRMHDIIEFECVLEKW